MGMRSLAVTLAALAAGGAVLGGRALVGAAARKQGLVSADVELVVVGGSPPLGVIVLAVPTAQRMVPLFVTAAEAGAVEERRHPEAGEPADLAASVLASLGAHLEKVVLDGVEHPDGRAEIRSGNRRKDVVGSVGELLEWAVGAHAPVWITPRLLAARGLTRRQIEQLAPGLDPNPPPPAPTPQSPTL